MTTPDQTIAAARVLKEVRRALEPTLKPLEGEIRAELSMVELAKLSTMLLTYTLDKDLSTESAAKNYIALQNTVLTAAMRAVKLPDLSALLPAAAKTAEVRAVLEAHKAEALLRVLGGTSAVPTFGAPVSFED